MTSFSKIFLASSGFVACLVLASCGSSSKPPADFSFSSTPGTITLIPGGAPQQVSVSAAAVNGSTGTVLVAIAGLPTGVTAQPSSLILTPGTAQNIAFSAAPATAG